MKKKFLKINFDFFTVIFPSKQNETILDFLFNLNSIQPKIGAFHFRSRFVRTNWLSDEAQIFNSINWNESFSNLQQDTKIFSFNDRSKFIVKPEALLKLGIHWVWAFRGSSYHELKVGPQDALIYHMKSEKTQINSIPIDKKFKEHLQRLKFSILN